MVLAVQFSIQARQGWEMAREAGKWHSGGSVIRKRAHAYKRGVTSPHLQQLQ
jgi:hypothetical protein